jgi:hypothetical protein
MDLTNKAPGIFIPNQKLRDEMGNCKDLHHLGDLYPWEDDVLRHYFGEYYKAKEKFHSISTAGAIMYGYLKARPQQLCDSLNNPANENFFLKREMLWAWLEQNEEELKLPFSGADGRNGKPFAESMPTYANMQGAQDILRKEPK